MSIYFDNSATTKMFKEVSAVIDDLNEKLYANPSAMHRAGFLSEEKVKDSSRTIADIINCDL